MKQLAGLGGLRLPQDPAAAAGGSAPGAGDAPRGTPLLLHPGGALLCKRGGGREKGLCLPTPCSALPGQNRKRDAGSCCLFTLEEK